MNFDKSISHQHKRYSDSESKEDINIMEVVMNNQCHLELKKSILKIVSNTSQGFNKVSISYRTMTY